MTEFIRQNRCSVQSKFAIVEQPFERRMTVHVIVKTKDTTNVIDVNG